MTHPIASVIVGTDEQEDTNSTLKQCRDIVLRGEDLVVASHESFIHRHRREREVRCGGIDANFLLDLTEI